MSDIKSLESVLNLTKAEQEKCISALRCLSAALPEGAKSGHPGAPLGCSAIVYAIYMHHMRFSVENPKWLNRDRFVLSNGHACALLYAITHFMGYLKLEDLKNFRRLNSLCPGHPERNLDTGIEVTTGPLGQGISQAVGLSIASLQLAERYNKPGMEKIFDNYIYCLLGDGCLQEGISYEACSLAGHLKLHNLIVFFDNNNITIDGSTAISTSECISTRFKSINWQVLHVNNAHKDYEAILDAIAAAKANTTQPTFIICDTIIGYGSKVAGTEKAHGAPVGVQDILKIRKDFNIALKDDETQEDMYTISQDVYDVFKRKVVYSEKEFYQKWMDNLQNTYKMYYTTEYNQINARMQNKLTSSVLIDLLSEYNIEVKSLSTRQISGKILNIVANELPELIGGSADLTTSTCVQIESWEVFSGDDHNGNTIRFGIREHGMIALCNGISAFGFHRVFSSLFLNFLTYGWGAARLSALSHLPVLYICTHDSIELGEDGPTHQPVEVASLVRSTPNIVYFRPADAAETAAAYISWLSQSTSPYVLALCRSGVPNIEKTCVSSCLRGAYLIENFKNNNKPKFILGSCGSELHLCLMAYKQLLEHFDLRLVSMPSWCLFRMESKEYQNQLLPQDIPSLYVEATNALGYQQWFKHAIHMTTFGASANKNDLLNHFKFTPQHIIETVHEIMKN